MRLLVVHNPDAGDGSWARDRVERLLRDAGHEPRIVDSDEDWRAALESQSFDAAVAAGGDGTVGELALALRGRSEPLAILPTGTANNIARSFTRGGPWHGEDRVAGWGREERELRLATLSESGDARPFLEAVGAGPFADLLVNERDPDRRKHLLAHLMDARSSIADYLLHRESFDAAITIDGVAQRGDFVLIACLNLPFVGPRLNLAPSETPDSGLLTVCAVPASDRQAFAEWLVSPARRVDDWHLGRGRSVVLTTGAATHVDGDGRAGRPGASRTLELEGGTASVRVWI